MSPDDYEYRADRAVNAILTDARAESIDRRRETAAMPTSNFRGEEDGLAVVVPPEEIEVFVLTLEDALDQAIRTGRDYVTEQESLYLTALSLSSTRNSFSPLLSTILSYNLAGGDGLPSTQGAGASAGFSKILPWGADLSADVSSSFSDVDWDGTYNSGAVVRYSQPLLRGSGHRITHEPLIQAERNVLYAVRDFERFREAYTIDVARRYYDLVQQMQSLGNLEVTLQQLRFGREQAEAKFAMGEIQQVEVLRAIRSELNGENDLLQAEQDLALDLERFRVFLGLPDTARVEIVPTEPDFVPIEFDIDSGVEVALVNRLDYLNARDRLEDNARALNIARDALRGSLDLSLGYGAGSDAEKTFASQDLDNEDWSVGLTYGLPVDRVAERNSYRATQISYKRALRNFEQFEDTLVVDLRNRFRSLQRIELSIEIQKESIETEVSNVEIATILFENGENSNRDVVEARENLLRVQNALVREQVNYEIQRLNLLRDLGILFVDENGMWSL